MDESAQTMQELTSNCMWKKSSVYLFHLFMYSKMIPPTCACVLCLLLMCLFCICLLLPQGWKKRWCELSDHLFRYYKNDSVRPMYFHFPPRIYIQLSLTSMSPWSSLSSHRTKSQLVLYTLKTYKMSCRIWMKPKGTFPRYGQPLCLKVL